MGGSGGWSGDGIRKYSWAELNARTDRAGYDAHVEGLLQDTLSDLNDRDVKGIQSHLETISKALSKDIEGTVQLVFGGSVRKHTYADGISDVDALVCLNDTSLDGKSPEQVMAPFEQHLRDRLPNTKISRGRLATTVKFSDGHEVQLLPAVKTATGYRIPNADGQGWSNVIAPDQFAKKLTDVNKAQGGRVVPIIKLYKTLNDAVPKPAQLSGYHIESLAIEAFENYTGRQTSKDMLRHFCEQAMVRVLSPILDNTGQSVRVDDYLGDANSRMRKQASQAIANLARKIHKADEDLSLDVWEEMLT
jgi:hypothetical protein